jgi:hypothetical protein
MMVSAASGLPSPPQAARACRRADLAGTRLAPSGRPPCHVRAVFGLPPVVFLRGLVVVRSRLVVARASWQEHIDGPALLGAPQGAALYLERTASAEIPSSSAASDTVRRRRICTVGGSGGVRSPLLDGSVFVRSPFGRMGRQTRPTIACETERLCGSTIGGAAAPGHLLKVVSKGIQVQVEAHL